MARVNVPDDIWAAFRSGLGVTPINVALGRLVEREVGRHQRRAASDLDGAQLAIEDARAVNQEMTMLIARLEHEAGRARRSSRIR